MPFMREVEEQDLLSTWTYTVFVRDGQKQSAGPVISELGSYWHHLLSASAMRVSALLKLCKFYCSRCILSLMYSLNSLLRDTLIFLFKFYDSQLF